MKSFVSWRCREKHRLMPPGADATREEQPLSGFSPAILRPQAVNQMCPSARSVILKQMLSKESDNAIEGLFIIDLQVLLGSGARNRVSGLVPGSHAGRSHNVYSRAG